MRKRIFFRAESRFEPKKIMLESNYLLKHTNDQLSKKLPTRAHELFRKFRKACWKTRITFSMNETKYSRFVQEKCVHPLKILVVWSV